ncbi:hypothetical protein WR25_02219 [Diploscapter pachys]|uniref:Uncharacterized protein n=1 Tax=Diploscapter pachys TaxID=2018661 RepID=A0A2A2JYU7_9BILA|nr:hypothetical protein WR25_02219 [Diploscapter pachys]
MVSIVLATAISSSADVDEDDHDQCLGLEQPADRAGIALGPFEDAARQVNAGELAAHRRGEQQRGDREHGRAAHAPLRLEAGRQEIDGHHREQDGAAEPVHPRLAEPMRVEHRAGQERADHEVQAGPVGGEGAERQPDQADVPAIVFRQRAQQLADCPGRDGEADQEARLSPDALPVEQDQREHAPDRDIVEAGVAQHALAQRRAQDGELFHQQHEDGERGDGAGHADAEHHLPVRTARPAPAGIAQDDERGEAARD